MKTEIENTVPLPALPEEEGMRRTEGVDSCKKCGGEMRNGVTLVNGVRFSEDFAGDLSSDGVTVSEGPSDGSLVPCIKCIECGHSFIP